MGNICSSETDAANVEDRNLAVQQLDDALVQEDDVAGITERDVKNVQDTWGQAAALGVEAVGKLVFTKIFELAPGALQLFSFRDEDPSKLYEAGGRLEAHASKVVLALDTAVKGLNELGALVPVLKGLGLRHVAFNVKEEHYDVVIEALGTSLSEALGAQWTCAVKKSWGKVLNVVKETMLAGADEAASAAAGASGEITVDLESPEVDLAAELDGRDIQLVQQTWGKVKKLGFSAVGRTVFKNIFTAAPPALQLFSFKEDDGPDLYNEGGRLDAHGVKVVTALDAAVGLLGEHEALMPVLKSLGMRHGSLGVVAAHYDVVGQAVVDALAAVLDKQFTTPVKNAWLKIYTVVKNTMVEAADEAAKLAAAAAKKQVKPKTMAKKAVKKKSSTTDTAKKAEAAPPAPEAATAVMDVKEKKRERMTAWKAMDSKAQIALAKKMLAAAQSGDAVTVEACLAANCNVDCFDASDPNAPGETPLHFAVANKHTKIVKMLINEYGADLTVKVKMGEWGLSPLHYAARVGDEELIKLVYDPKMEKDSNNYIKCTPAAFAKKFDQKESAGLIKKAAKEYKK